MKQESEMPGDRKEQAPANPGSPDNGILSRRNILLAGTSLAAATAINAVDLTQVAQAQQSQQPAAAPGRKPNILVIWGDDVGITNISAYSNGLMGYETPNIDRRSTVGVAK
jgi:arylsulfatase